RRVVRSRLDPACPTADVRRDGWELAPVDRLGLDLSDRTLQRAADLAGPGVPVLGLGRGGGLRALVQLRPALRPEADDLVALARSGNLEVAFALRGDASVIPLEACAGARAASLWSARTATLGASLAAFLAFRPLPGTGLRVGTAVNGAALVAMAGGTRSAMALAHRPRPLPRDPTPWHALEPQAVLERTGSGPDGLSPAEAGRRLPPRQE